MGRLILCRTIALPAERESVKVQAKIRHNGGRLGPEATQEFAHLAAGAERLAVQSPSQLPAAELGRQPRCAVRIPAGVTDDLPPSTPVPQFEILARVAPFAPDPPLPPQCTPVRLRQLQARQFRIGSRAIGPGAASGARCDG
jgi:hypothetical protein